MSGDKQPPQHSFIDKKWPTCPKCRNYAMADSYEVIEKGEWIHHPKCPEVNEFRAALEALKGTERFEPMPDDCWRCAALRMYTDTKTVSIGGIVHAETCEAVRDYKASLRWMEVRNDLASKFIGHKAHRSHLVPSDFSPWSKGMVCHYLMTDRGAVMSAIIEHAHPVGTGVIVNVYGVGTRLVLDPVKNLIYDLTSEATVGCLLKKFRQLEGNHVYSARRHQPDMGGKDWYVLGDPERYTSEAEALLTNLVRSCDRLGPRVAS